MTEKDGGTLFVMRICRCVIFAALILSLLIPVKTHAAAVEKTFFVATAIAENADNSKNKYVTFDAWVNGKKKKNNTTSFSGIFKKGTKIVLKDFRIKKGYRITYGRMSDYKETIGSRGRSVLFYYKVKKAKKGKTTIALASSVLSVKNGKTGIKTKTTINNVLSGSKTASGSLSNVSYGNNFIKIKSNGEKINLDKYSAKEQRAIRIMASFQDKYPEGTRFTNEIHYYWNGGVHRSGYGCAAFAMELSDAIFGKRYATMSRELNFNKIKVGDIIGVIGHYVIIMDVRSDRYMVAQANYNSSVHWGGYIYKE